MFAGKRRMRWKSTWDRPVFTVQAFLEMSHWLFGHFYFLISCNYIKVWHTFSQLSDNDFCPRSGCTHRSQGQGIKARFSLGLVPAGQWCMLTFVCGYHNLKSHLLLNCVHPVTNAKNTATGWSVKLSLPPQGWMVFRFGLAPGPGIACERAYSGA